MGEDTDRETIVVDAFDREYGLTDLLPLKDLKELLIPLTDLFYIEILRSNGSSYFSPQESRVEAIDKWRKAYFSDGSFKSDPAKCLEADNRIKEDKVIYALTHEGETIGYFLAAAFDQENSHKQCLNYFGSLAASGLNQMIRLNCKVQMTYGLHGQIVEDSYLELKKKAGQLAQSEKKYRLLSESLEEEVKKKTQTIQKALSKMAQQEKMASVGQLAAGVAHEINNPTGFILSNLNTLKDYQQDLRSFFKAYHEFVSANDPKEIMANLKGCRDLYDKLDLEYILSDLDGIVVESIEGAERIKRIVMNLKEFSKPGLQEVVLADLNHQIETVVATCRSHVGEQIQIIADLAPLPQILCHPQEINQAILNILLNAVQAVGKEGQITIKTLVVNDQIEVTIADTGCGIEKDDLSKIFDPFFTTKEVGFGTGLGLTFAYNVVRKHNGIISVDSNIDQGTRVTLRFPMMEK
jgi:two-component system, NtrC family, sensor kinase